MGGLSRPLCLAATALLCALAPPAAAQEGEAPREAMGRAEEPCSAEALVERIAAGTLDELALAPGAEPAEKRRRAFALGIVRFLRAAGEAERTAARAECRGLAATAKASDVEFLRSLSAAGGREAEPCTALLLEAAYRDIGAPEHDIAALLPLARAPDGRARGRAVAAIARRLAALRGRVWSGGSLTEAEQRTIADPNLIALLVDRLVERESAPGDVLGASAAAAAGVANALHALVLLGEPALPALGEAAASAPRARVAIAAIEAEMACLRAFHPKANWASATGRPPALEAPRREGAGERRCPCGESARPGARYCSACGRALPQ